MVFRCIRRHWLWCLLVSVPVWAEASTSMPPHGLEIQGFGSAVNRDAMNELAAQGQQLRMDGQLMRSSADSNHDIQRVYSLAQGKALILVGSEQSSSTTTSGLSGTLLLRMHETGVALTRQLSRFATLGWPQQNADLRVFPEISGVLSANSGDLRVYPFIANDYGGLLLVSPDQSRLVSYSSIGAVLVYGIDGKLQAVLWPDAQIVANAKQQMRSQVKQLYERWGFFGPLQDKLVEPYVTYQWVQQHFSWYQKDGQWHLQGLGLSSEPEPRTTDIRRYMAQQFERLIVRGEPFKWRNFQAGHPGFEVPADERPDATAARSSLAELPRRLTFKQPLKVLGIEVDTVVLSYESLTVRLFSKHDEAATLAGLESFFTLRGMKLKRVNENHLRVVGAGEPLFITLQKALAPHASAVMLSRRGLKHYCVECWDE